MKPVSVDAYIQSAPPEIQERLIAIRNLILETVPHAIEKISYSMPYYGYKGRLAYFAYFKHHIGLYIPPPVIQTFADELREYETAMATVRFPHDKKLPLSRIKKMIKLRAQLNDKKS